MRSEKAAYSNILISFTLSVGDVVRNTFVEAKEAQDKYTFKFCFHPKHSNVVIYGVTLNIRDHYNMRYMCLLTLLSFIITDHNKFRSLKNNHLLASPMKENLYPKNWL